MSVLSAQEEAVGAGVGRREAGGGDGHVRGTYSSSSGLSCARVPPKKIDAPDHGYKLSVTGRAISSHGNRYGKIATLTHKRIAAGARAPSAAEAPGRQTEKSAVLLIRACSMAGTACHRLGGPEQKREEPYLKCRVAHGLLASAATRPSSLWRDHFPVLSVSVDRSVFSVETQRRRIQAWY